jgi:hypothetical protein
MPLIRALKLEDIRPPSRCLGDLLKRSITGEQYQIFLDIPGRAFFPDEAEKAIFTVGEYDRAFGGRCIDKVRPSASGGTAGFEGEERLRIGEGDGHEGCKLVSLSLQRTR